MAEFRLTPRAALGGLDEEIGATTLREVDGARPATVSIPLGGKTDMQASVKDRFGCDLPEPGTAAASPKTDARILRLGNDRLMVLQLPATETDRLPNLPGYLVDQSDFWVMLDLAGPLCVPSLERTCRLDLDLAAFPSGAFARTPFEGISTLLYRLDLDRFLLLAPRSYARSFVHILTTSLSYVSPPSD